MGKKIMVVEDDKFIRKFLKYLLEKNKYMVVVCKNGIDAVCSVERENPDLILMDINMPLMDGIKATKKIKSMRDFARIPVIMVSSLGHLEELTKCLEAGADCYVIKPFDSYMLLKRIKEELACRVCDVVVR
ncbi:MAG: response regulator [Elusimicrobia bacterium]|jgi:DNA-binding response OmpR family regulator|nr:response regulator [Elusimicrobiota bacterium]